MSKNGVPDAWDDDYEAIADSQPPPPPLPATIASDRSNTTTSSKISRSERKAQHYEANKQLWASADNPERQYFLEARGADVPLKSDFKPAMQVLSRKPAAAPATQDEDEDSEEERRRAQAESAAERSRRAQAELEEKKRRYREARERLLGSAGDAPAADEPASVVGGGSGRNSPTRNAAANGRGRGRGGQRGGGGSNSAASSADASPARAASGGRQLYDPNYSPKPGSVSVQKRDGGGMAQQGAAQPIRHPKGPDGSGRGGFGFAPRGSRVQGT